MRKGIPYQAPRQGSKVLIPMSTCKCPMATDLWKSMPLAIACVPLHLHVNTQIEDDDYMSSQAAALQVGNRCEVNPGGKRGLVR